MELKRVDSKNLWDVVKLSVNEDQKSFVATNGNSILEAYVTLIEGNVALPFGIYHEEELVGFVMLGYGTEADENMPKVCTGNYCIWRFMIDKAYQRRGYGREALLKILEYIKTGPCGKAEYCWLSYEPENEVAKKLYSSVGFAENGEMCEDEIVAVLKLTE